MKDNRLQQAKELQEKVKGLSGFPPAVIKATDRARYYDALDHAHTTGDDESFIQLVSNSVNESLDLWLSVI